MRIKPRALARRGAHALADQATCLAAAPAGGLVAAGSYEDAIVLLDEDMKPLGQLEGHPGGSTSLAFAAGGKLLVSAGEDGAAAVWCCESKTLKARLACEGVDADRWGVLRSTKSISSKPSRREKSIGVCGAAGCCAVALGGGCGSASAAVLPER